MRATDAVIKKLALSGAIALLTLILGGCAGAPWGSNSDSSRAAASAIELQKSEIEAQKADLARREAALAQRQRELEAAAAGDAAPGNETQPVSAVPLNVIPPDASPGECYAQVIVPAQFRVINEQVVKREASERIEIIPAEYETVEETVEVKPATTRLEVVPAVYETVTERVLVKPATTRLEVVPATYETVSEEIETRPEITSKKAIEPVYETVTETVLDKPARKEWKFVTDLDTGSNVTTSDAGRMMIERYGDYKVLETRVRDAGVWCLVEIPATYKTVTREVLKTPASTLPDENGFTKAEKIPVQKTVLKTPATTREVTTPAEYREVEVTRLVTPATTREIPVPAEYRTVTVTRLVRPERERRIPVEAVYEQQISKEKISDDRIEWRPVLCKVNMTRDNVSAMQSALRAKSPACGMVDVDGIFGPRTGEAVKCFARKEGLSYGSNYVTMDVIRALGLKF